MWKTFRVEAAMVYFDRKFNAKCEHPITAVWEEPWDDADGFMAIKSALRFATRSFIRLGEPYGFLYVGSLKVSRYPIGAIDETGMHNQSSGQLLLEWKCDTSSRFPDHSDLGPSEKVEINGLLTALSKLNESDWFIWGP